MEKWGRMHAKNDIKYLKENMGNVFFELENDGERVFVNTALTENNNMKNCYIKIKIYNIQ